MIEDLDIEELGGPLDFVGDVPVRLAGLQFPTGVIVCEQDAHGEGLEHHGKEDAQIYQGSRDSALRDLIDALDLVAVIEQDDLKGFVDGDGVGVPCLVEQFRGILGGFDLFPKGGWDAFFVSDMDFVDLCSHDDGIRVLMKKRGRKFLAAHPLKASALPY